MSSSNFIGNTLSAEKARLDERRAFASEFYLGADDFPAPRSEAFGVVPGFDPGTFFGDSFLSSLEVDSW